MDDINEDETIIKKNTYKSDIQLTNKRFQVTTVQL